MSVIFARRLFLILLLTVAGLRYVWWWPTFSPADLAFYNDQAAIQFTALVLTVDNRLADARLVVVGQELSGRVLLSVDRYPEYHYGDLVAVSCRLKSPQAFDGFAYDKFLAKDKIYSLCYRPKISLRDSGQGSLWLQSILAVRDRLVALIDRGLPAPQSAVLKATLVAQDAEIPPDLVRSFALAGLSHVMAISGMNITILVNVLFYLLLAVGLARRRAFYGVVVGMALFMIMIGWPASALRAAVMGGIGLLAMQVGRLNTSLWTLTLTTALMLALNPLMIYDAGFQLSVAAVAGIVRWSVSLSQGIDRLLPILNKLHLTEMVATTLSAQLMTLPLILYNFGNVSIVSLLANLLVLPIATAIMIGGALAVIVAWLYWPLSQPLWWCLWLLLTYFISVAQLASRLPGAALTGIDFNTPLLVGSYLALAIVWQWPKIKMYVKKV
ncbi:ComEC/Rec2 family competence protein [Candidatus Falkowbacteria bacterium]|nr:ComEC/Rec2 family competence protein [Candidatus Falkowbacteria bacterium]